MDVQDQLALFYWMRLGAGVVVLIGAALFVYAVLGPVREQLTARAVPVQHRRGAGGMTGMGNLASLRAITAAPPFYLPQGRECELFEVAWRQRLPLLLKGPTGCGKTRFVAHMAAKLGRRAAHGLLPRRPDRGRPHRPLPAARAARPSGSTAH